MERSVSFKNFRQRFFKRLFDLFFSLSVLIFLSPLYLLLAVLIKCSSPGSVFYRSQRIGRGGKVIGCLKFRTMEKDADAKLQSLLASRPELADEWKRFDKLHHDPRVTPLGKFLRKTSLDELPQFFNVLMGDLSVVGPRALHLSSSPKTRLQEIRRLYGEKTDQILSVRPGITGIWQISGRSFIPLDERCKLDALYVQQQTFWKDVKVICKTIPAIFQCKGAF